MKEIKFRGKRVDTGEFVFGDIAHTELGILMGYGFEVDPDSVAQFVGYDLDGAEVYEGDKIYDKHGIKYVVRLIPQVPVAKMTVKEDNKDEPTD